MVLWSISSVVLPVLLVPLILGARVVEKPDGMTFPLPELVDHSGATVVVVARVEVDAGKLTPSPGSFVLPALVAELSVEELYRRSTVVEELLPVELVTRPAVVDREPNLVVVDADGEVDGARLVVHSLRTPVGNGDAI